MAKGPFMEYLRAGVVQDAANVYAEVQIPTPTSKTENMAMLIHTIEMHPSILLDAQPAQGDMMLQHVSRKSKDNIGTISDEDILAYLRAYTTLNAVYNGLSITGEQTYKFDPPILYPRANLYMAMSSIGMGGVASASVRIGYTLEKVSREDFISALVE
ncbi:hypothetical protein ES705_42612 [subsurface metagenome]